MLFRPLIASVLLMTAVASQAQIIKMNPAPYNPVQPAAVSAPAATAESTPTRYSEDIAVAIPSPVSAPDVYEVTHSDKTLREVIDRWARSNGWIFKGEHWTIDKDFPVQGAAGAEVFGKDFKQAVRTLLSSTELTDQAVQPCFYSNRVIRVIPMAGQCNNMDAK